MARNLLYHVCPLGNYRWNLEQILKRIDLFDGEKIFAVAQGDNIPDLWSVQQYLPADKGIRILPVANDTQLRETASLQTLLAQIVTPAHIGDITFYAHTKGTTHNLAPAAPVQPGRHMQYNRQATPAIDNSRNEAILLWTEAMYRVNLDDISKVEEMLRDFSIVGAFRRYGSFKHFPMQSTWHYSGTFFWFNNEDLFECPWSAVPQMRYGAEAYPSMMFKVEEAGCLFADGITDMYSLPYVKEVLARGK